MKNIDNSTSKQLHKKEETLETLQNKCAIQEQKIHELTAKVNWYEEMFRLSQHEKFGSSSEKTPSDQISFFNEAEKQSRETLPEPDIDKATSSRRKPRGLNKDTMANLPTEVIEYDLPQGEQICPECQESLHKMSKEIRKELVIIPAQVKVIEHVRNVYSCRNCEQENIKTPVITSPMPAPVLPGSFVSPSLMAFIMNRKYAEAIPLYRQEQQFINFGIDISRQNLANWIIQGANRWLRFIYDRMHSYLVEKTFLHADESTLQVLQEDGRSSKSKSYMWLYATGKFGPPIFLYNYQQSRSGRHPKDFLSDFKGFLQTDGYPGYNDVENVTLIGCFAHARRGFTDALKALPDEANTSLTVANEGIEYCNKLFEIERRLKELKADQRYEARLKESKPVLEAFYSWLNSKKEQVLPKSSLGKAIKYCLNQWSKLEAFMLDGQIELSNNRAERAIKPFVIGRKNFLFCKTPKGAEASAIIYSVIETAKANNLSPFHYLNYLFERLPNIDLNNLEQVDELLPWASNIPNDCKVQPQK